MAYANPVLAVNLASNVTIASPGTGSWDGIAYNSVLMVAGTTRLSPRQPDDKPVTERRVDLEWKHERAGLRLPPGRTSIRRPM